MKVVFLVRSLEKGGAERQLVTLAKGLYKAGETVTVAVFYAGGELEPELEEAGIPICRLGKKGRSDIFGFWGRLIRFLRHENMDVLYSHLPGANILAVVTKPLLGNTRLAWRLAASYVDLSRYDQFTRWTYWLEARLSRFADLIVVNSRAGLKYAVKRGFPENRLTILPNGFDINWFRHDHEGRQRVRKEWGVPESSKLIGLVGRLDPMKDHPNFLQAAVKLTQKRNDVHFVCVGDGPAAYTKQIHELARRLGFDGRVIWAGMRDDMPAVHSAIDVGTCASYGEGFPNVVGEAMACGTPCVVTDVGDCDWIVGNTGVVVPAKNPNALVQGWQSLLSRLETEGAMLGKEARERIENQFSEHNLVEGTNATLKRLLSGVSVSN